MIAPSQKKLFVTWDEVEKHIKTLSLTLRQKGSWDKLVCITRGGLVPASLLSHSLNIKYIDTLCLTSYDNQTTQQGIVSVLKEVRDNASSTLVIDDLVDSDQTFVLAHQMLPNAHMACVYAKPNGIAFVDSYVASIPQETWIVFPWEVDEC